VEGAACQAREVRSADRRVCGLRLLVVTKKGGPQNRRSALPAVACYNSAMTVREWEDLL
jgi:hypothetical protein